MFFQHTCLAKELQWSLSTFTLINSSSNCLNFEDNCSSVDSSWLSDTSNLLTLWWIEDEVCFEVSKIKMSCEQKVKIRISFKHSHL